jgi:flagellar hook-associated protein 2
MADLGVAGLASNFDWRSLVDQLTDVERAPQRRMQTEQSLLQRRQTAYSNISAALSSLKTKVDALKEAALFTSRQAEVADKTVATVSAAAGAAVGTHDLNVVQLATTAAWRGTASSEETSNRETLSLA